MLPRRPIRRGKIGFLRKEAVFCISNIKLSQGILITLTNYFDKIQEALQTVFSGIQTEQEVQAVHPLLDVVSSLTVCPVTILKCTNVTDLISSW